MNKHLINIAINGVRTFVLPATLFVVSYFVVSNYSKELWGSFVVDLLLINLIALVLNWGNKEHLVRSISKEPNKLGDYFYKNFFTRSILLLPAIILLFFLSEDIVKTTWLISWLIGLFIYQSAESLIVYTKKFGFQVVIELIALVITLSYLFTIKNIEILGLVKVFTIAVWVKALFIIVKLFPKKIVLQFSFKELLMTLPFFVIGFSGLLQSRIDQYVIALFCDKDVIATYQIFLSAFILLQSLSAIIIVPFNKILYRISITIFNKVQLKITLLSLVIVSVFGLIISWLLNYLYQLDISIIYYLIGILFAFPPFVYVPIIYLFYRVGKEKEIMIVNYLGALFNLALTLYFVFYGNPFNAIIASAIAQWLMLVWYIYRKKAIVNEVEMSSL